MAMNMPHRLNPVMPAAPIRQNRNPPAIALMTPRKMSRTMPPLYLFTILLAIKPAIRPKMIQPMMDI
jgi:hypothetical protein